jgi:hypothetical protein
MSFSFLPRGFPWSVNLCKLFAALIWLTAAAAQQYDPGMMKAWWRPVGPFRGGRVLAVTGIPGDPTFTSAEWLAAFGAPPTAAIPGFR